MAVVISILTFGLGLKRSERNVDIKQGIVVITFRKNMRSKVLLNN